MADQRRSNEVKPSGRQSQPATPPIRVQIPAPPRDRQLQPRPQAVEPPPRRFQHPPLQVSADDIQAAYGANVRTGGIDPLLLARAIVVLAWVALLLAPFAFFNLQWGWLAVVGLLLSAATLMLKGNSTRPGNVLSLSILGLLFNGLVALLFGCSLYFGSLFHTLFGWIGR